MLLRLLSLILAALLLTACVDRPTTYEWGSYEDVIYASYLAKTDVPPEKQIEILEKDYQVGKSEGKRMPPGWHAHLGFLYYQIGRLDQARQELLTEKAEFPESAVFVDRLLTNLSGGGKS